MPPPVDPTYDAFISYSHKDRPWVDKYLLPRLEQAGLRVAIDYRDFEIGAIAQENMERFVDNSRHVVLLMSPNSVQSDWAGFEYLFAGADDPIGRRRKLIPVLIAPTDLPRRLSIRTYADLTNPEAYEREMARVIRALQPDAGQSGDGPVPAPAPPPGLPSSAPQPWQTDLAELLVRSGRAQASARRALCIEIGVEADELTFAEAAPRDFAAQLVKLLDVTGNSEALLALCAALRPVLKGVFAQRLLTVEYSVRRPPT